jgi:DNA-binding CsgD family transcriptional regulator
MIAAESQDALGMQLLDDRGCVEWTHGAARRLPAEVVAQLREGLRHAARSTAVLDDRHIVDAWMLESANDGTEGTRMLVCLRAQPEWMETAALTARQLEIAELASDGATIREVAVHLGLSCHTVRTHLRNVYRLLGVGNRLELAHSLMFVRART